MGQGTPMKLAGYTAGDFARGAPFWKEALWWLFRWIFFDTSLPWPSALRCAILRTFGASIGNGVVIRSKVNVTFPWRLTLGDHVWLGDEVLILSLAPVTIESDVCISQRAFLCTGSHDYRRESFDLITKPITVRQGVWIAASAFIGPGDEIAPGAVIAAGSVVLDSVPSVTLMRGNPATAVRTLA